MGFPGGSAGKESTCNTGDPGLIPGSGRSAGEGMGYPLQYSWAFLVAQLVNVGDLGSTPGLGRSSGEGKGYPLQYSGLENSMDSIAHEVSKSQRIVWKYLKKLKVGLSPHVRGQGQKPGGPHARRAAAKRSYLTSEVRAAAESTRLRRCRNC